VTIADVLKAELEAAATDLERGCDRAADAATLYITRRLQQLERRFPRHRFVYAHRRYAEGLHVYPAVCGYNSVRTMLTRLCGRSSRWGSMLRLGRVDADLDGVAKKVANDFDRLLGRLDVTGQTTRRIAVSEGVMAIRDYENLLREPGPAEGNRHGTSGAYALRA